MTKPALGPDVELILRTAGINDADGREFLRTVLPPTVSWAVRGQDLQPVKDSTHAKIESAGNVQLFVINGNLTQAGEVQIVRGISFQETTAGSDADSLAIGVAGTSVVADEMLRRHIKPDAGAVGYWIGDSDQFTTSIMAWLPIALYEGQQIRITLRRPVLGTLGGTLKILQEVYQEPYRGGSI